MSKDFLRKGLLTAGMFLAAWLLFRYLLPVLLPFVLGTLLALAAEPMVRLGVNRLKLRRGVSTAIGVTVTLVLLTGMLSLVGALLVKELAMAARAVPNVTNMVEEGMTVLEDWLIRLADRAPEGVRPALQKTVLDTFDGGSALIGQVTEKVPGMLASTIGWVSEWALTIGTGIIAAFMISSRLPHLKKAIQNRLPQSWNSRYLPALKRIKTTLGGWFRAQLKLMLVTWGIVSVGLLLLQVPYGPLWAALIALVDAIPILGTGTVLLPWALVRVLQGQYLQGIGLVAVYGVAWLCRTVLEPRLVGQHIGLDPLVTLGAFYIGFQIWGVPGMILAPMLTAAVSGAMNVQK